MVFPGNFAPSLSSLPNDPPSKIPKPATEGIQDPSLAQTRKILFPGFLRRDLANSTLESVSHLVKAADGRELWEGSCCCSGWWGTSQGIKKLLAGVEDVRVGASETTLVYWESQRCGVSGEWVGRTT